MSNINLAKARFYNLFFPGRKEIKDQTPEEKDLGTMNSAFFTEGVVMLRDYGKIQHETINRLARLLYMLVNQRLVTTAMTDDKDVKKGIHFFMEVHGNRQTGARRSIAMILIRPDWYKKVIADPWHELGGIVTMASQACDFYHNMVPNRLLAYGYEAEFLKYLTVKSMGNFRPNAYQRHVMRKLPNGLDDLPKGLMYHFSDFKMGSTRAREKFIWEA